MYSSVAQLRPKEILYNLLLLFLFAIFKHHYIMTKHQLLALTFSSSLHCNSLRGRGSNPYSQRFKVSILTKWLQCLTNMCWHVSGSSLCDINVHIAILPYQFLSVIFPLVVCYEPSKKTTSENQCSERQKT